MAIKPAAKKTAVKPTVQAPEKKYYYSLLRREIETGYIPLEDCDLFGPFSTPEACVEDYEGSRLDDIQEGVLLVIVEGVCVVSLKEERKVVVERSSL